MLIMCNIPTYYQHPSNMRLKDGEVFYQPATPSVVHTVNKQGQTDQTNWQTPPRDGAPREVKRQIPTVEFPPMLPWVKMRRPPNFYAADQVLLLETLLAHEDNPRLTFLPTSSSSLRLLLSLSLLALVWPSLCPRSS